MTIEQANQYFAALTDGFASTEQLRTAFTAPVQKVQFVGVAGTAGKTVVARLLAAILHAQGIHAGLYHAGSRPLSERAARWPWWSCRMRALPKRCPVCRCAPSPRSARTA